MNDEKPPIHWTGVIMGIVGAAAVVLALRCTSLQGPDAGGAGMASCASPTPGQAGCVLPILARNLSTWSAGLDEAKKACGVAPEVSTTLWAAHTQAEVLEGFVPRAIGSDGGVRP